MVETISLLGWIVAALMGGLWWALAGLPSLLPVRTGSSGTITQSASSFFLATPALDYQRVALVVGVALRAMRFPRVVSREADSTQDVLALCDRFQVARVEAPPLSTQVVNLLSCRDMPNYHLICEPVDFNVSAPVSRRPIPLAVAVTSPRPTLVAMRALHEQQSSGKRHAFHTHIIATWLPLC